MDRLKELIKELGVLAKAHSTSKGADVCMYESKIYDWYLADLREAIASEKAKTRPVGEREFWTMVEEYVRRLKPSER
jgi:hypothetical protein